MNSIRALPRLFVPGASMETPFQIPKPEFDKLHNVLRLRSGAIVGIMPNDGSFWECELEGTLARPLAKHLPDTEPSVRLTIAQALPKGDKLEEVIRSCTELGAIRFIVFPADRSIVRWEPKKLEEKLRRLNSVAQGAAETAFRMRIPTIEYRNSLTEVLNQPNLQVLSEMETEKRTLRSEMETTIVIGPEGGWAPREVAQIEPSAVTLGPRVLRTEHAGFAAAAKLLLS